MPSLRLASIVPVLALLAPIVARGQAEPRLELRKGDHVSVIGNTLADRMQHDGWLEAFLFSRFPGHDLVVRNLGFSGDEIELSRRIRSADFGSPDSWLSRTKTDVVLAFFGYNESFAGAEGLPKFKDDLTRFLKHTLSQKYNGKDAPRVVLFSPLAHENLRDRNLPDGSENNKRLALYAEAMKDVARAEGVTFVDLFTPSKRLYEGAPYPLTINGVHPTEDGGYTFAKLIDESLFGEKDAPQRSIAGLEKIRKAVLDRNFTWFNRYRTVDGYSIYGGRADLRFVGGQTNRVVMDREMEVLDVMTANRDKKVWAVAKGEEFAVDDGNTPPFIPVTTNKPGQGPNGEHVYLDGEAAIAKMTVGKGLKVQLFASEKEFPDLINPVQMAFDTKGRLWVATWPTYPHWKPKDPMNDKLIIYEDTDGDGKADKQTIFADGLHCPTGFEFAEGGVLVAQAPDLVFLKDNDGDDKADVRKRVLSGLDSADTHHTANSFTLDPGGALYFQEGTFHHTQVETPYAPTLRNANAGIYRYEPKTQKFDAYVTYGFANPHGHAFDRWGQDIVVDGTGANPYHGALFSGHLDYPNKHAGPPQVYRQRTRPCPGVEFLTSRHFPDDFQGNLLVPNVIGFQGILRYKIDDDGASLAGTELEPILSSTDENFRPADIETGPDGAIYFTDWQNPVIGHMQHNLRDPSRDRIHGRIYKVTHEGRPLLKPAKVAGEPIEKLLDLLKEPEDRTRSRAKIELGARATDQVLAALAKWRDGLDKNDPEYEHHMAEALWVQQYHNAVDDALLKRMLNSPNAKARAAAVRVLCYSRDKVPGALELLKEKAADPDARVRMESVRAASFFALPEAVEVPLISAEHPTDPYLDYVRNETMKAVEPHWKKAVAEGKPIRFTSDAGARFFLKSVSNEELLKMPRSRPVFLEMLFRPGLRDEARQEALSGLAMLRSKPELPVLIDAIRSRDEAEDDRDESVTFDLARLLTGRPSKELAEARDGIEKLATASKKPVTRQLGFVALIAADGGVDRAWSLGEKSVKALADLLAAMPLIRDPNMREALYPKVVPLLKGLPESLGGTKAAGTYGRFVRIELTGNRTLTLAEVEVLSDGRNVARQGKATQKNTAYGGDARRAIDGNKDPSYGGGGQTHTEENTRNPWWEVDLGSEVPIESIAVYNRADGLGDRLRNYTLKVLDNDRNAVFTRARMPAPSPRATIEIDGGGSESIVRRAAMNALTYVRGQETPAFVALVPLAREGKDRAAAIRAIGRIPIASWPKEEAAPLLESLMGYVRSIPTADRTSPAAMDALQLADSLAALLPLDAAKKARKELGDLGVRQIRLGTLPERMLFDKDRLAVRAGKPVQLVFENNDMMPHNFVVTKPGALEKVGMLGETTATSPGAAAKGYVPDSPDILVKSALLQPRDAQALNFTAPEKPGVYPYVCTYPGHWRRMYGSLYVVEDLDEYLADPEGYLAGHPLPIADSLLELNRPRKEWTFAELAPQVEAMAPGRSFANGKLLFRAASCVACHKVNGEGKEFGPDLAKLDAKVSPVEILKSVLEPSDKIEEKFAATTIATDSGKVITGLVVEETNDVVKVVENPLVSAEATVLKKSEIAERKKSAVSPMPKGLLDRLTREEVLDLIAYVAARGEEGSKVYSGGHLHH